MNVSVLIPVLNEEQALPHVLADLTKILPGISFVNRSEIIVCDNGSTDRTAELARTAGARVALAPRRGYGSACQAGIAALDPETDVVVFLDGDHSEFVEDLPLLLAPLREDKADLVLGARRPVAAGSLSPQQRFGNAMACWLLEQIYGHRFTDLGPFRALRRSSLQALGMKDSAYGWTIEMQIKALRQKLRVCEVVVRYRPRIGESKISGTWIGSFKAGRAILGTIAKYVRH
jgi:glycosyltransferase involved in cell wall biosynthesis